MGQKEELTMMDGNGNGIALCLDVLVVSQVQQGFDQELSETLLFVFIFNCVSY